MVLSVLIADSTIRVSLPVNRNHQGEYNDERFHIFDFVLFGSGSPPLD